MKRHLLFHFDLLPSDIGFLPSDIENVKLDINCPQTELSYTIDMKLLELLEASLTMVIFGGGENGRSLACGYGCHFVDSVDQLKTVKWD